MPTVLVNARKIKSRGHPAEYLWTSGWDCASTLVIHDHDDFRGDCVFRHLDVADFSVTVSSNEAQQILI
jgi:hypothetical protein